MIRHIVFFTVERDVDIERVRSGLARLTQIPCARRLEIAVNRKSDPISKEVDVVVYGEFDDEAALVEYKRHALYAEAIRHVRPLREMRLAVDYEVEAAITRAA